MFSRTAEEHSKQLGIVFKLLRKGQLQIKPWKCIWGQTEPPYLVSVVGRGGIKPDPKKVKAVTAWPASVTVKAVQQFPEPDCFFQEIILGYAKLAAPLIELTK